MWLTDMIHDRDIKHYMDDHIHVVLLHIVVYISDQLFDIDPNGMHVDMYELHMEEVDHMVDHIILLLNDKEPKEIRNLRCKIINIKIKIRNKYCLDYQIF